MRINFRQGIVSHQTDSVDTPTFLDITSTGIDILVSPSPTIIAFVHGDTDYLYTESKSVPNAWTLPTTLVDTWLYWDLGLSDGLITRGSTQLEPIEQATPPTNAATGQMWYDSGNHLWYEWNGIQFIEVVRVFAARLYSGTELVSTSINAPNFKGTQVGLTESARVGSLVYGSNKKPLRNTGTNTFFTTEDTFVTGVPTAASLRINSTLITGVAQCPLAAYQVVQYDDFGEVCSANPALEGQRLFGIIEEDVTTGDVVNFITEGIIFNENWDWVAAGGIANQHVYIDATGQIEISNMFNSDQPVGVIISQQEIYFAPKLFVSTEAITISQSSEGATDTQVLQLNSNTSIAAANAALITELSTDVSDLSTTIQSDVLTPLAGVITDVDLRVLKTGDTLTGSLQAPSTIATDVDTTLITKDYADRLSRGYQANFTSSMWSGEDDKTLTITQGNHQLPLNTLYQVTVQDATTSGVVTVATTIDKTSGSVTLSTTGAAFSGTVRIT